MCSRSTALGSSPTFPKPFCLMSVAIAAWGRCGSRQPGAGAFQHDVYGNVVLALRRLSRPPPASTRGRQRLHALELMASRLGGCTISQMPASGSCGPARIHTSSALMCWAACDRLAHGRPPAWRCRNGPALAGARHQVIHAKIIQRAWSHERQAFVESFGALISTRACC